MEPKQSPETTSQNPDELRGFKGIWIPRNVWLSNLTHTEKGLVCEIDSLCKNGSGCFASNGYFATFLGISEHQVTMIITKLKKKGIILQQKFDGRRRFLSVDLSKIPEQTLCGDKLSGDKGRPYVEIRADLMSDYTQTEAKPLQDKELSTPISKPNNKVIIENPNIQKIQHFVQKFYALQKEQFPNFIKQVSPAQIKQSCDTIDKLVRIDRFSLAQVFQTILWATEDSFWARQVLSITGLRNRSKNGLTKFQNILVKMGDDNKPTRIRTVQGDMFPVKLDLDAQRLADFTASVLGNELIRPRTIQDIVNQMRAFYGTADKLRDPHDPFKRMGPTEHYTWDKFFREWLEFLEEKQASHFELRSVNDLQVTGCRWREYVRRCEEYSCYDWSTGKRRE